MDERLEKLINRKLDEQLDDAESLELDKLLIRDPEAREMLAEAQRIDRLAAECLHDVCDRELDPQNLALDLPKRLSWSHVIPTAIAACLLATLGWQLLRLAHRPLDDNSLIASDTPRPQVVDRPMLAGDRRGPITGDPWLNPLRRVNTSSTYYTVYDAASGKMYMLEVRETGSSERQNPQPAVRMDGNVVLTSGEM